jgi:hypothetical protein
MSNLLVIAAVVLLLLFAAYVIFGGLTVKVNDKDLKSYVPDVNITISSAEKNVYAEVKK